MSYFLNGALLVEDHRLYEQMFWGGLILYFDYYFQLVTYTIEQYCSIVTKQQGDIITDRLKLQRDTLEKIKKINEWESGRWFTQTELQGVTLHTINALVNKGVLEEAEPFGISGAVYYKWTGKELE